MPDTGNIHFTIVDGRRQLLSSNTQVLVRLLNGATPVPAKWATGGDITISDIPFADTGNDAYNVFVHASSFEDTVTPYRVPLVRNGTVDVGLLATPVKGQFHFQPWQEFEQVDPRILRLVSNGAPGNPAQRYSDTLETRPMELGALLVLATAIRDIPLDDHTSPLDNYYWQVIWDLLAPDRFWAWVDARLADRIKDLSDLHAFAPEADPAFWHKGIPGRIDPATRSWKQTRFDVTNVQLTFHEATRQSLPGPGGSPVDCVIVEPDIDLYKELLSHGLTEVIPNLVTDGKTDPRTVYSMRWMATRQEHGVPEFDPPVTVEQ
jgi:hypothetical protein